MANPTAARSAFPDNATWIGAAPSAFAAAPLGTTQLRTTFELPAGAVVTRARAFVASPGYCTLRLDGHDTDDSVLGAFTVFTRRILYDVLDLTELLRRPANSTAVPPTRPGDSHSRSVPVPPTRHALALTLANGWYSQPTVNLGPRMASVVLRIGYTVPAVPGNPGATTPVGPGELTAVVVSDGSWRATHGPAVLNDFYRGVTHDARVETPGWELPAYTEPPGRWVPATQLPSPLLPGSGVLRVTGMPPIRRAEAFTPHSIRWFGPSPVNPAAGGGGWVVDFGQNIAGTVELSIPAAVLAAARPGTNITIRHAETVHPDARSTTSTARRSPSSPLTSSAPPAWRPASPPMVVGLGVAPSSSSRGTRTSQVWPISFSFPFFGKGYFRVYSPTLLYYVFWAK